MHTNACIKDGEVGGSETFLMGSIFCVKQEANTPPENKCKVAEQQA